MKKSLQYNPCISKFLLGILILMSSIAAVYAQKYPVPADEDTTNFGSAIQRTMKLLATSTPNQKNTVKILVYGQSISHGTWWLNVKADLKKRFPNANLIMENKAIGGFSSESLRIPFYNDVLPYNYDLILLHVYGSQFPYDSIVRNIRSFTTAEMALQNDHGVKGSNGGHDEMSYVVLPRLAKTYKVEYMDVRTPWTQYLDDYNLSQGEVTTDGTHLNEHGSYLLGALISRHLAYKPKFKADPFETVKVLEVGKDVFFDKGKLNVAFDGNRVEFVSSNNGSKNTTPITVTIDSKKPSEFIGCSFHLRANDSVMVPKYFELHVKDPKRIDWPWNVATILRINRASPVVEEDWTITINNLVKTSSTCTFDFTLKGSVTGNDGGGKVAMEKRSTRPDSSIYGWVGVSPVFVSNSKRVVIGSSSWYVPQPLELNQPQVAPIRNGYKINWHSTLQAIDNYTAPTIKDATIEEVSVIAHGLPKGTHNMQLTQVGTGDAGIKYIKLFNPFFARPESVLAINAQEAEAAISLYPNPATNLVNINLQEYAGKPVKIEVYNMMGGKVDNFVPTSESTLSLNTENLMTGMYMLKIDLGNSVVVNKKFNIVK